MRVRSSCDRINPLARSGLFLKVSSVLPERRRQWILVLLCLSTVLNYLDRQALSVVLPLLREELSLSSSDYGNITTGFLIAYTLGQLGLGIWIDRVGARIGLVASMAAWSLAGMAHAMVTGFTGLAFCRVLLGLGEAGNWPAGSKAVAESFPPNRRAFAMGVFDCGSAIGAGIAPPLVAWLAMRYGWRTSFLATGFLGVFWIVGWLAIYKPPVAMVEPQNPRSRSRLEVFRTRQLWGLMLTRALATPVWWFYVFWLPDYLASERGFGLREIGFFAWIPFVTVDLGKLIGGGLSDRLIRAQHSATFSRKSVMGAGAVFMMGGLLVVDAATAAGALYWVSIATFGFGLWSANTLAIHADIFHNEEIATAIGWTGMAASFGGAIFTFVVGQVIDHRGYGLVFTVAGLSALFAFCALVFAVGKIEQREEQLA